MQFSYKIHRSGDDILLALADADIVGKKFSEKGLSVTISPEFYGKDRASETELISAIESSTIINAFGEKSISLLAKNEMIQKSDVVLVCGLPHAQIVRL